MLPGLSPQSPIVPDDWFRFFFYILIGKIRHTGRYYHCIILFIYLFTSNYIIWWKYLGEFPLGGSFYRSGETSRLGVLSTRCGNLAAPPLTDPSLRPLSLPRWRPMFIGCGYWFIRSLVWLFNCSFHTRNSIREHVRCLFFKMSDKLDKELLIHLIENRAGLWDKSNDFFSDQIYRKTAWREICITLYPFFEDLEEKEKSVYGMYFFVINNFISVV